MNPEPMNPEPMNPEPMNPGEESADDLERGSELAAAGEEHDPTGLDLARQIAASIGAGSRGVRRRRQKPRPRSQGSRFSGAHPDDRDPMPLGAGLDRLIEEKGWNTQVNVHLLLGRWTELVGSANAEHSRPESYADDVLTVRTSSTAWATQLRLIAPQLVARLNAELGDGLVTKVVVKGPDAPSWKHGRRSVQGRGPRDTYG
jgi:predicted nucleic acid-binding Zn ribbon protein